MSGRGCPTRKLRFATEAKARAELVGRVIAWNKGKAWRQERRLYECPKCRGFHLTSQPLKVSA